LPLSIQQLFGLMNVFIDVYACIVFALAGALNILITAEAALIHTLNPVLALNYFIQSLVQ